MAEVFQGPAGLALGGTSAAGPETHDSLLGNPALASFAEEMDVGIFYADDELREPRHHSWRGIQMIDNTQNLLIAGGLGYFERRGYDSAIGLHEEKTWLAGGARPFATEWSVGGSIRRSDYVLADRDFREYDANLGILRLFGPAFSVGYVLQNFAKQGGELPRELRRPLQHVLGVNYLWEGFFRWRMDLRYQAEDNPDQQWVVHAGIESAFGSFFVLRLGGQWDKVRRESIGSAGLGFMGPRLRVNYAYQRLGESGQAHSVDIRLPL